MRVGSCGYESISDQLFNDGGQNFAAVKGKLLAQLTALPADERPTFAAAMGVRVPTGRNRDAEV